MTSFSRPSSSMEKFSGTRAVSNCINGDEYDAYSGQNIEKGYEKGSDDLTFPEEKSADGDALEQCLSPLLTFMKLFGAYFEREEDVSCEKKSISKSRSMKLQRIYCKISGLIIWLNGLRYVFYFNRDDGMNAQLFVKVGIASVNFLCAIMHTSYYIASKSGKLKQIMRELRVSRECITVYRKFVMIYIAVSLMITAVLLSFMSYFVFFTNGSFDFLLTPFVTVIPLDPENRNLLRAVGTVLHAFIVPAWIFMDMMNHILALVFFRQFRLLNKRFRRTVDVKGHFHGDLATHRRRHFHIGLAVTHADSFIMLGNVAGFVIHMINVILCLFTMIYCDKWEPPIYIIYAIFGVFQAVGLLWTTVDGIMVNHEVRKKLLF